MRIALFCSSAVLVSDQWLALSTWRLAHTAKIEITTRSAAINRTIRAQMRRARDALCAGLGSADGADASGVASVGSSMFATQSCTRRGWSASPHQGDCRHGPSDSQLSFAVVSYDPAPRERQPRQLCPKCNHPLAPNARYCPNCGSAIGPDHSNIWPIVLASVIALLVGAAIAFAIGGTGGSTKTVTHNGRGKVVTKQGTNTVTIETRTRTATQTTTATAPTQTQTQTQTVTNTVTVTTPTTSTTG